MASFHVDHDSESVVGVREVALPAEVENLKTDPESIEGAPREEEFAEVGVTADRKINYKYIPDSAYSNKDMRTNASDNLKTMPERKRERSNRGSIREVLHNLDKFFNKN